MKIYVRSDASARIGTGHVMRCLTLADRLRAEREAEVVFLCRELEGHLIPYIRSLGFEVNVLPKPDFQPELQIPADEAADTESAPRHADWLETHWSVDAAQTIGAIVEGRRTADWLIVDHYALDRRYEEKVRPFVRKLMVIDDLADRPHACDLLLDQNWDGEEGFRYRELVEPGTRLLIGPRYALLREEFSEMRGLVRRTGALRRVLVSFGGVDATGETAKTLEALRPLAAEGLELTVLAGRSNPRGAELADYCRSLPNARFHHHTDRVASMMLEADLAIGAGGSSTWERCCLGLPALLTAAAYNQESLSERTALAGAAQYLGKAEEVGGALILEAVRTLRRHPSKLLWMSARAMELTDGLGAARTVKEICG